MAVRSFVFDVAQFAHERRQTVCLRGFDEARDIVAPIIAGERQKSVGDEQHMCAGSDVDTAIATSLRLNLGVVVAPSVVEMLKCTLCSALGRTAGLSEVVLARTVDRGRLKEIEVSAELVNAAAYDILHTTMRMIQECLGGTPPDLSQDVSARGMTIAGGHANIRDLDELVATSAGVEVSVAPQSDLVVIQGLQACLEEMSSLHALFRSADR